MRNILIAVAVVVLLVVILFVWGVFEIGEEAVEEIGEAEAVETE